MVEPASSRERILLLYLKTGGGHLSTSHAVRLAFAEHASRVECFVEDGLPGSSRLARPVIEGGYGLASVFSVVWVLLYNFTRFAAVRRLEQWLMSLFCRAHIAGLVRRLKITRVVTTHFLLIRAAKDALASVGSLAPLVVLVTDPFTAHPIWFFEPSIPRIVFSRLVERSALRRGVEPGNIRRASVVIDKKFEKPLPDSERREIRRRFGFDETLPLVLFAGGGEGYPGLPALLRGVLGSRRPIQSAVVCGRNKAQAYRARRIAARHPEKKTVVFGFVPFMFELMNAADIVFCKAGPATVMEILALRKPLVITSQMYGQERGNVDFVLGRDVGAYDPEAGSLVRALEVFLHDDTEALRWRRNAEALGIHSGADEVCRAILETRPPKQN